MPIYQAAAFRASRQTLAPTDAARQDTGEQGAAADPSGDDPRLKQAGHEDRIRIVPIAFERAADHEAGRGV